MEITPEYCQAWASELLAAPQADRLKRVWSMAERAVNERLPALPIVLGMTLRDRGAVDWAEYVFNTAMQVPDARGAALFELSVVASLTGRPAEAATLLAKLEAEQPLDAYKQRAYAHQLTRLGDREGAVARIEAAHALEPWAIEEHTASRQFLDYWLRHPLEQALARCEALKEAYRFISTAEVAAEVDAALDEARPYAMIRLNDGEGSVLHLSISDEADYHALYTRNRREFHTRFWFGDVSMEFDAAYTQACRDLNALLPNMDCLSAYHAEELAHEYRWASHRNVPSFFNVVRKLEQITEAEADRKRIALCDPKIALSLVAEGHLERLIRKRPQLGLVSCHAGLPDVLKRTFGLEEVFFHRTPGEASIENRPAREPFGVWHDRLKAEIAAEARPGVLYLVAAGIPGKLYADIIKRAGGIVLDIGIIADIWMRAPTRPGIEVLFEHHALVS